MTVKIDIDKYTSNSAFIGKMLHMADQGKFGEAENNNGMLDTDKEATRFLKLAENNKALLKKLGYEVAGNSSLFTIKRTKSEYDSNKYNSTLTYDKKHDFIEEMVNADGISTKTYFNNNNEMDVTILDGENGEPLAKPDNNGTINSMKLVIINILTFGYIGRRLDAINDLSFIH